jgi:DNA-binding transcriptional LysR family regulator
MGTRRRCQRYDAGDIRTVTAMHPRLLPHLDTFAAAAERSSFTAAARELGVSQAAISQRIQQLEDQLKTPLFRREGGRVALTAAGLRLHDYARRILELTAEAREAVTGTRAPVAGTLVIAASSVPGQHLLPHVLATFCERFPLVRVRVAVSDTEAALRQVERGRADLGFVGGSGDSPHLEFSRLTTDELVLVVPRRHPWWRRKHVLPSDLIRQKLVQRERGSASRGCFERSLEKSGTEASALNVVLELGSGEAVREAVLEGAGIAVLSRRAVQADVRAGRLKPVRVDQLSLRRELYIVRDRRRVLSAPARRFLAFLTDHLDPVA